MKHSKCMSYMRLTGFLRKEFLQILRDPSSIALAIVMPLLLLMIFGYGVTLDAEDIPVALVVDDHGQIARELSSRFFLSPHFTAYSVTNTKDAQRLLEQHKIDAFIHIPMDFSTQITRKKSAQIQIILNGVDANRARLIQGYMHNVVALWNSLRQTRGEPSQTVPLVMVQRIWFNEEADSTTFMVPGLITLIMTLIGILLTALVIAREWERGTMEALLVTPIRRFEFLLGKIIPYYFLGMIGMTLSVGLGIVLFHVPFRGSFFILFFLSSLFMLASLGFGLLLSAAVRIQFVAAQISIVAGFLPAFFLSGLLYDLESMPRAIQIVSHIVPARYFVAISHTLFMAGNIWSTLLPNACVLAAMAGIFILLAYKKISKRLDS